LQTAKTFVIEIYGQECYKSHSILQAKGGANMVNKIAYGILVSGLVLWTVLFSPMPVEANWARTYGGGEHEFARSVQQISDGGYIVAGYSSSFGAGNLDGWVVKLDANGAVLWQNTYGGAQTDYFYSVQQTSDGGYIVAGETYSFGAGSSDIWVLKLDGNGTAEWQKTYGGSQTEYGAAIQQTSDGGYIVGGTTYSFGRGSCNAWVLKLNENGSMAWQKTYGGTGWELAHSIQQTSDGGYIVGGQTYSFGDDHGDAWVLKLDDEGAVEWEKRYGAVGSEDYARSVQQTSDGGYIVAGMTKSFGAASGDAWVLKLDDEGAVEWEKRYGGNGDEHAYFVHETTPVSGYIVAGRTNSFGQGGPDAWLLKLAGNGAIEWQKTYGSGAHDEAEYVGQTSDNGYVVAGRTYSFGAGKSDAWILKLDANGSTGFCPFEEISTATGTSTAATVGDTGAETTTTAITGTDTSVAAVSSNASSSQVCPLSSTTYLLKVGITAKRQGVGTVMSSDRFIYCPTGTCEHNYYGGFEVTLIADAAPLSTFMGWKPASLGCAENNPTCPVTMDKKKSVKAIFQGPNKLKVVTTFKNGGAGTVRSSDGLVNCPDDCEELYKIGDSVTLTATPDVSSTFVKWTGTPCKTATTNECTFPMNKNYTVKAIFQKNP
jgi:hypothetical protein